MERPCARVASAVVALAVAGALGTPARALPALSACPAVSASLDATIDTKIVKAGELFRFTTTAPASVDGRAIPTGTRGVGMIETMDHSKSRGQAGYLVLDARYLELTDGTHVPVALLPGGDGRSQSFVRAGSSDAGLLTAIPYYVGTAFGAYDVFHHGKDAAFLRGTAMPLVAGDGYYAGTCTVAVDREDIR